MKIVLKIFFLIFNFTVFISPQFYQREMISPYVIELMAKANEISKFYDDSLGMQKVFTDKEMEDITNLFYKVIESDPVGYNRNLFLENSKWEEMVKTEGIEKHNLKPAMKLKILKAEIGKKYGENFAEIISIPAFIRGTVISENESQYQTFDKRIKARQTNLVVVIEDVLKGNKFFSIGDTITISYLGSWFRDSNKNILFEVGKTYFLPLTPWGGFRDYNGEISIDFLPDNNYGIYPIDKDIIFTEGNYFGKGNTSSWLTFKEHFIKNYIIDKGGK